MCNWMPLKSDYLTQGPIIKEIEGSFCLLSSAVIYAIAVNNATGGSSFSGLRHLMVNPGDNVICKNSY